jgi:hypothetical protein
VVGCGFVFTRFVMLNGFMPRALDVRLPCDAVPLLNLTSPSFVEGSK